ncbi:NRT1/ PTR family 3.1-like protein [Tanacetum coccineum]
MKSTAIALHWTANALGQYSGTLMVTMVHKYTAGSNGRNWLPDRNLNKGRLEYYYMLVSGIQLVNFFYYYVCAWLYTYKPLEQVIMRTSDDGNLELAVDSKVVIVTK